MYQSVIEKTRGLTQALSAAIGRTQASQNQAQGNVELATGANGNSGVDPGAAAAVPQAVGVVDAKA